MIWLAAALVLCVIAPVTQGEDGFVWCYHDSSCNDATWPVKASAFCNGSRQSPINIISGNATIDANLTKFNFTNFDNISPLTTIENTGETVRVNVSSGVSVSGGDLSEVYDTLQFHLHWGNGSSVPGSEHTVDGKRYPMELHIVNVKSSLKRNLTAAAADSKGHAAFGFFIDVMSGNAIEQPASWKTLTSYLVNITKKGQSATISAGISLDDLLAGVDRTKYYRYLGSLTIPNCNEAVVWTVFKEPVKVSKDLIDLFSTTVRISNVSTSALMVNVYRGIQPAQRVTQSSSSKTGYSLWLITFIFALWMR